MTVAQPRSLFRTTFRTVFSLLLVFQLILIATTVYYVVLPMAHRSADDLAALLIQSARTWVELPPETRKDFELELMQQHQFLLFDDATPLPPRSAPLPYLQLLDDALSARLGEPTSVKITDLDTTWFWAEINAGGKLIRIGFPRARLHTAPTKMLLVTLLAALLLSLLVAYLMARRITRPLAHFVRAAQHIGDGAPLEKMPDSDIQEFAALTETFNQLSQRVSELLANRTTLLAGISHDLRAPLARMRLAVEMLPESEHKQAARLRRDIDDMNVLIGEFLALSRDLQQETQKLQSLHTLLQTLVEDARTHGAQIEYAADDSVQLLVRPLALRRVLSNLLGNALRYGAGQPVHIETARSGQSVVVRILDRGPGIPPQELDKVFRPFYRVESSRSADTGGSGLGLAIVRQLCTANGWQVALHAREGGGTIAELKLAVSEPEQRQP